LDYLELEDEGDTGGGYLPTQPLPTASSGNIIMTALDTPVAPEIVHAARDHREALVFDVSVPLFFPVPPRLRHGDAPLRKGQKPKDLFDIAKERGWEGGFWRTATE
jgi:hypothetical protein